MFVDVSRGPGGLTEGMAMVGELVFRGPVGFEILDDEAAMGSGEDRRRE